MSKQLIGSKQRKKNRRKELEKKRSKIKSQINAVMLSNKLNNRINNDTVLHLLNKIFSENSMPLNIFANNYCREIIIEGVKQKKWFLNIPPSMSLPKKKPHFRSDLCFIKAKIISSWLDAWGKYQINNNLDENDIIASTVVSATVYGGLNISKALVSLVNQLISESKPLYEANNVFWCDLIIHDKRLPTNYILDETKVNLRRWFPDNSTLLWINNLLLNTNKKNKYTERSLWTIVYNFMTKVANEYCVDVSKINSLRELCDSGIIITERLNGIHLNQVLTGFAKGDNQSVSLQPEFLKGILINDYPVIEAKSNCENLYNEETLLQEVSNQEKEENYFYKLLKSCVYFNNKKNNNKKKPSRNKVLDYLYELEPVTEPECCLHNWIIFNLEERKNKVSTANSYLNMIGKIWLQADNEKVDILDEEELEQFLQKKTIGEKDEIKKCFNRFLKYSHVNDGVPNVKIFNNIDKPDNLVRAGFISEQLYFELLENINKSSQRSQDKLMLLSFFIFAYRTGLRLTEIKKIRIRDIEDSDELWVYVKPNQHEDNKTLSGYRKFNLGVLLTKNEYTFVKRYIHFKKLKPNVNFSSLLFSYDFTPSQLISNGIIYKNFRRSFAKKYNLPFVFHLMRHTALSKLFVILSDNKNLIKKLTCYSETQIKRIQKRFNFKSKNIFYNLGALAGHSSPKTTFQSYVHFCDYLLFCELNKYKRVFIFKELEAMSGCSRQYLSYYINKEKLNKNSIPLNRINKMLATSLKKYCNHIKVDRTVLKEPKNKFVEKVSSMDCLLALREIEKKNPVKHIPNKYIEKWVKNAKFLSDLKTQKGKPRLFSKDKTIPKLGYHLAPTKPQTLFELNIAKTNILDKAQDVFNLNKPAFRKALHYFVNNSTYTVPGLKFNSPEMLSEFLEVIKYFYNKKHIIIEVKVQKGLMRKNQIAEWKSALRKKATYKSSNIKINRINDFPYGQATLHIQHPEAEKLISILKESKELNRLIEKLENLRNLIAGRNGSGFLFKNIHMVKNLIMKLKKSKCIGELIFKLPLSNDAKVLLNILKETRILITNVNVTEVIGERENLNIKKNEEKYLASELSDTEEIIYKFIEAKERIDDKKKTNKTNIIHSSNLLKFTFHLLAIMALDFKNKTSSK